MKVIEGNQAILGRLASYTAKEALKGEEIAVVNCEKIIITGNRENIQREFDEKIKRVGHGQTGPKYSRDNVKMVKRVIRGMVPNHREGRGREALKRIKCYKGVPKEFEKEKRISITNEKKLKFIKVEEVFKK
jgi:large subunit ribosomal protein L13